MANQYLRILNDNMQHEGRFCERVHVPMTFGSGKSKKVAINYSRADMKGHTAMMQVVTLEDESAALISLTDFRRIGRRGIEVGKPLKLGSLSFNGQRDFPQPEARLGGYLIAMHEDGATRFAGLIGDSSLVHLEGMTNGHVGDVAVAFLDAISSHVCQRMRQKLLEY